MSLLPSWTSVTVCSCVLTRYACSSTRTWRGLDGRVWGSRVCLLSLWLLSSELLPAQTSPEWLASGPDPWWRWSHAATICHQHIVGVTQTWCCILCHIFFDIRFQDVKMENFEITDTEAETSRNKRAVVYLSDSNSPCWSIWTTCLLRRLLRMSGLGFHKVSCCPERFSWMNTSLSCNPSKRREQTNLSVGNQIRWWNSPLNEMIFFSV